MTYANLAQGRSQKQLLELDMLLAPNAPETMVQIDRTNAREMQKMGLDPTAPKPQPLPHMRRQPVMDA